MRKSKRLLSILVFIASMLVLTSATVHAKTINSIISTKSNTWYTQKAQRNVWRGNDIDTTNYFYRVVISQPSEVKIQFTGKNSFLWLTKNYKSYYNYFATEVSGLRIGLDKGTYYIRATDKAKFRYTVKKASFTTNYSRAKALALKKNVRKTIVQTPLHDYTRWYKVSIAAKQRLTVWTNANFDIRIADSSGVQLETSELTAAKSKRVLTKKVVPKGTYYIAILDAGDAYYPNEFMSYGLQVGEFYWK